MNVHIPDTNQAQNKPIYVQRRLTAGSRDLCGGDHYESNGKIYGNLNDPHNILGIGVPSHDLGRKSDKLSLVASSRRGSCFGEEDDLSSFNLNRRKSSMVPVGGFEAGEREQEIKFIQCIPEEDIGAS